MHISTHQIRERVGGKKNQSQTELVSETHLGNKTISGKMLLLARSKREQEEQEEEAEKPSEAENLQMRQTRELRILSGDWFCFFSLCVVNKNMMMLF